MKRFIFQPSSRSISAAVCHYFHKLVPRLSEKPKMSDAQNT